MVKTSTKFCQGLADFTHIEKVMYRYDVVAMGHDELMLRASCGICCMLSIKYVYTKKNVGLIIHCAVDHN